LEGADRSAIYGGDHHALVKSEKIVLTKQRPEVLPAALRNKVRRYVSRWQKEFKGRWPRVQPGSAEEARQPGRLERYADVLKYRTLRTIDFMIIVVFCFAPLSFLEKYRTLKGDVHPAREVRGNMVRPAGTPAD